MSNGDRDGFIMIKRWLENRNAGKTFEAYFKECGYGKIAIYGAGDLGNLLYEELKDTSVRIMCFVDRNAEGLQQIDGIPVVLPQDVEQYEEVDIMVVTPVGSYGAIYKMMMENYPQIPMISLKDAVYEM